VDEKSCAKKASTILRALESNNTSSETGGSKRSLIQELNKHGLYCGSDLIECGGKVTVDRGFVSVWTGMNKDPHIPA
jgi:hypothetical protein